MVKIQIKNTKECEIINQTEDIYREEHKASNFHIELPKTIGANYKINECTLEMRVYFPNNTYFLYNINTNIEESLIKKIPITNEITDTAQELKIMFIFKKDNEVIGKTNFINIDIKESCNENENPLTPRAEFDKIIREQRETIESQSEMITEQQGTISEQSEQITELSGEVTELTTENTRLENLTETQRDTIQYMVDNPPAPKLYTPPVVTPSGQVQQITVPQGYDGLSECTVDRVTAEVDSNIQPQNIKEGVDILGVEGTYNPFPENSVGGIYITEVDTQGYPLELYIKNWVTIDGNFPKIYNSVSANRIERVIFDDCPNITNFNETFDGWTFLEELEIPPNITELPSYFCRGTKIQSFTIPNTVTTINRSIFENCKKLKTVFIPNSITTVNIGYMFWGCINLEFVTIENGFNCKNFSFSASTLFTAETIVSCLEALADRTGQTAYTITFGSTNLNKLTAEQKAIATNKNWNLA